MRRSLQHLRPMNFWSGQAGRLKDGGGITSNNADWSTPRAEDSLKGLRQTLLGCIARWNLVERLTAHIAGAQREHLLNDGEQHSLRREFVAFLTSKGFPCTSTIEQGQPLTLEIWHALLAYLQDILQSAINPKRRGSYRHRIRYPGIWCLDSSRHTRKTKSGTSST